ncbi:hypothetical protein CUJ89_22640 [Burkholderia pyrrocinia]|uniref:Uncharacterized protein n=1 Tax=Burkholderia pyrrocinia TaxID=60550 RepID=A0A2Z5N2B9_BURPY|nr:hypothetical protein [Burkholderia pyrrocinia]AXF23246.1 hypothetical protein CUJ89_22640 [Burkholderia pyrrocinia]
MSLTVGELAARDDGRHTGNACDTRMIAWIAGSAFSPAKARRHRFEQIAGMHVAHSQASVHTSLR